MVMSDFFFIPTCSHENAGGYYRLSAFFLAKVIGNLIPNKIIPLIGFTVLSYFLMGTYMV